jgi:CRISPR-associated protein Csy2
MKSVLVLRNLEVQNANALSGVTWGFPAITHFLGFTHALSRKLPRQIDGTFQGCGVVCHSHQTHSRNLGYDSHVLAQTRNPLKKDGSTPSFVEEGRVHLNISLVIACNFDSDDIDFSKNTSEEDIKEFENVVYDLTLMQRLAGGTIIRLGKVEFFELPDNSEKRTQKERIITRSLLPGYCLVDRTDALERHFNTLSKNAPNTELLDAWLDFIALKYQAEPPKDETAPVVGETTANWVCIPKPAPGWLVPIQIGYRALSEVFEPGSIEGSRDNEYPFRFAEAAYSIGAWLGLHRIAKIEELLWYYEVEESWYLCVNKFSELNDSSN